MGRGFESTYQHPSRHRGPLHPTQELQCSPRILNWRLPCRVPALQNFAPRGTRPRCVCMSPAGWAALQLAPLAPGALRGPF